MENTVHVLPYNNAYKIYKQQFLAVRLLRLLLLVFPQLGISDFTFVPIVVSNFNFFLFVISYMILIILHRDNFNPGIPVEFFNPVIPGLAASNP